MGEFKKLVLGPLYVLFLLCSLLEVLGLVNKGIYQGGLDT